MKELLRYIRAYKKESILAPLFKLLEATFELFVPLIMASIIDRGIDQGDMTHIWKMALILFLLAAVGLAASLTAQYFAAKAAVGFATDLKHDLFAHIQALPFDALDQVGTSTMITRMTSDVNQVQNGVNLVLRLFLRSPFIVLGAMVMAFTIDWKGALVFAVAIPLLTLVVFGLMFASIPLYKKVQGQLDQITGRTRDNLTGARVIRAFNKQKQEVEDFEEENQTLNHMQTFVGRISALMNPVTFLIINGAMIALIWIGALRVDAGLLTQGQVFALVNYMSQILVELVKLANLIISVNKAAACGRRIQDIFEMEAGMKVEEESDLQNEDLQIFMDHVYMSYGQGAEPALEDINLKVKKGQTIGIIGGTGSGKSTLVHLLPRFYDISQGQLRIEGKPVKEWNLEELRKKIAIVQQKSVLFHGSIRSNLLWGDAKADDDRLWKALEIAQAKEVVMKKDGRLDAGVDQEGRNFSGGQRQRLSIARALVAQPEILIMDDSSSALDYATDAKLRQAIRQNLKDMTIFIVSQRAASVRGADQILVLDDGKVVGHGKHEDLLRDCQIYREIYESQYGKGDLA